MGSAAKDTFTGHYGATGPSVQGGSEATSVGQASVLICLLLSLRRTVIFSWCLAFLACVPLSFFSLRSTKVQFQAPKNSASARARAEITAAFPALVDTFTEVVVIHCDACTSVLREPFTARALQELDKTLAELNALHPGFITAWDRPALPVDEAAQLLRLASPQASPGTFSPTPFMSSDRRTMLWHTQWTVSLAQEKAGLALLRDVLAAVSELDRRGHRSGHHVYMSGPLSAQATMIHEIVTEVAFKEVLMSPIALAVLLYHVKSWRLAGLCCLTMLMATVVSMGTSYFIAHFVNLAQVCPAMVAVLGLALSVDYSLFIFARFKEEVKHGRTSDEALGTSLESSGHVVALSGTILVTNFALGLLSPSETVWSMALICCWTTAVVLAAHLTLTPCLMASFPQFFAQGLSEGPIEVAAATSQGPGLWFRWGSWITGGWRPLLAPLLLYSCMVPVICTLSAYKPRDDITLQTPRGSSSLNGYEMMVDAFPMGTLTPIYLLSGEQAKDVRSDASFEEACGVLRRLVNETKGTGYVVRPRDFLSPFAVPGELSEGLAGACPELVCLRWSGPPPECPLLPSASQLLLGGDRVALQLQALSQTYQQIWSGSVNADNTSAITVITTNFDQTGVHSHAFWAAMRSAGADTFISYGFLLHEIADMCYRRLPLIVVLSLACMSILVGFALGTVLAPIKLLLTVFVPIAFVYGVLVCVYQHGALDWMHWPNIHSSGIYFVLPMITLPMLLGLAVDYDIFLFSRVLELRQAGYNNQAAVVGGLAMTGPVITFAGLIMATAFFGLVLSNVPANCEVGFLIAVGVLVDTFVIRGLLVPSVLAWADWWNYWPRKMPEATRSLEDMEVWAASMDSIGGLQSCWCKCTRACV